MARGFQGGIGPGTLLAGITDVATTITSNALANLRAVTAPDFDVARIGAPGPNEELVQITAHAASSTSATAVRGYLGTTARAWNASDPFDISLITPDDVGGGGGLTVASSTRTAGNIVLGGSTTWAAITTAHDLVIAAVAGDIIEVGMSFYADAPAPATAIEMFTMNTVPARVNGMVAGGATDLGAQCWILIGSAAAHGEQNKGGAVLYTVVGGDIFSGNVTLRPHYRQGSAGAWTMRGTATQPWQLYVKNLGQ